MCAGARVKCDGLPSCASERIHTTVFYTGETLAWQMQADIQLTTGARSQSRLAAAADKTM